MILVAIDIDDGVQQTANGIIINLDLLSSSPSADFTPNNDKNYIFTARFDGDEIYTWRFTNGALVFP
jgi:hypothetical protein